MTLIFHLTYSYENSRQYIVLGIQNSLITKDRNFIYYSAWQMIVLDSEGFAGIKVK